MEATPVAHNAGEYRGFALAQLRILSDYCKRYNLNIASRKVGLSNGVIVVCQVCYNKEDVWVTLPQVVVGTTEVETVEVYGFLCKPRTTGTGYPNQDDAIAVYLHFNGSEWVTDPEQLPIEAPTQFYYGNIDWKGPLDEDGSGNVLSWKGPPTRYFPLDPRQHYEGLTVWEEDVLTYEYGFPVEVPYYTCFGPKIYSNGAELYTLPAIGATDPKVLGAAYGLDGKLFVLAGVNYRGLVSPDSTEEDPKTGGFYTELYVVEQGVFVRIAYWPSGRHMVPFFFNRSGTQAVTVFNSTVVFVTIAKTDEGYSATQESEPAGSYTATYNRSVNETEVPDPASLTLPQNWEYVDQSDYPDAADLQQTTTTTRSDSYTKSGSEKIAADFKGDTVVYATIQLSSTTESTGTTVGTSYTDLLEEYPYNPPEPMSPVYGPDVWTGRVSDYGVTGGCPPITSSYPETPLCGSGVVQFTDASGASSSKTVRGSGVWCSDGQPNTKCYSYGATMYYTASPTSRTVISVTTGPCGTVTAATGCYPVGHTFPSCGSGTVNTYSGPVDTFVDGTATISSLPTCISNGIGWSGSCFPSPGYYFTPDVCFSGCLLGTQTWKCTCD